MKPHIDRTRLIGLTRAAIPRLGVSFFAELPDAAVLDLAIGAQSMNRRRSAAAAQPVARTHAAGLPPADTVIRESVALIARGMPQPMAAKFSENIASLRRTPGGDLRVMREILIPAMSPRRV